MCSSAEARLALIEAAIEEVAAAARAAAPEGAGMEELAGRLARIWAMVAELDPGLARRLPGYTGAGGPAGADGDDVGTRAARAGRPGGHEPPGAGAGRA